MSGFKFSNNLRKKTFTIEDIKEDLFTSMFVARLSYTAINFDWASTELDGIPKSKINKIVPNLMNLGLLTTINFTKVPDKLIESLNKTMPNYYNNVDRKTGIAYLRNSSLFKLWNKSLKAEIENKWLDNETYINHFIKLENEYLIQNELIKKISDLEKNQLEREIKYPDGTKAIKKTARFWNIQLEAKRFQEQLLLGNIEEEPEERKKRMDDVKKMTREERQLRYNQRKGITNE